MKPFISTKFYGFMNYLLSFALLLAPWYILARNGQPFYLVGGAALFLPLLYGWLQFIMAVFSDNPHGFIKFFPMKMHLFLDVVTGSFLLASPFVYGFSDRLFWPQVVLGAILCIMGIFTQKSPFLTGYHPPQPLGQLTSVDSQE